MRVAVIQWGRTGAGPLFALELAEALHAAGEHVVVSYSLDAEIADRFQHLDAPSFGLRTYTDKRGALLGLPRLLSQSLRLDRFLRDHDVDVVIVAMEHLWQGVAAPIFRFGGRRTLLCVHDATMHPGDFSRLEHLLRRSERRSADGALVFSSHVASSLPAGGAFTSDRIWQSVHAAYRVDADDLRARALDAEPPVIGFFGRLSAYKGLDLGARAIAELRNRGRRVRFRVVGSGSSAVVDHLDHVDDDVQNRWVDQDEIAGVVGGFDLALLPYTEASQSGVLAYAMALGVPSIVTPVGGLAEQAVESGSAVVARDLSPEALADAIEALLDDPAAYRRLSEDGIAASTGVMSWARVAADTAAAVEELTRR
ncbi:glycosyltransferase family 4 protein [Plantibacter flavus]|uniref:glycosyltransferase family 4 protein n=1 Tax=Plantibacter flavus TaxID=150123 RepID=UPI003F190F28